MALVINTTTAQSCRIFLIPEKTLIGLLNRHVKRIFSKARHKLNTCLVSKKDNWLGVPEEPVVFDLLTESIREASLRNEVKEGESLYYIPHSWAEHLKCRQFNLEGDPLNEASDGSFRIKFEKIPWRKGTKLNTIIDSTKNKLVPHQTGEKNVDVNNFTNTLNEFKGYQDSKKKCRSIAIFIATRITPVRKRMWRF